MVRGSRLLLSVLSVRRRHVQIGAPYSASKADSSPIEALVDQESGENATAGRINSEIPTAPVANIRGFKRAMTTPPD
jgi:hypothetical protein